MPKTKNTDLHSLRKIFQERGPEQEELFLALLTPELLKQYRTTIPADWTPIENQTALYDAAGKVLFPGDPQAARRLGHLMASRSYSGIYKFFLQIPTVQFLIKQAAKIWRTFYDTGEAFVENAEEGYCELKVRDFPELTPTLREVAAGHLTALLEMVHKKIEGITLDETNPKCWVWFIRWR